MSSSNKILVTYTSRFGATAGVAEAIGKTLAACGAQVDVQPMKDVYHFFTFSLPKNKLLTGDLTAGIVCFYWWS